MMFTKGARQLNNLISGNDWFVVLGGLSSRFPLQAPLKKRRLPLQSGLDTGASASCPHENDILH